MTELLEKAFSKVSKLSEKD